PDAHGGDRPGPAAGARPVAPGDDPLPARVSRRVVRGPRPAARAAQARGPDRARARPGIVAGPLRLLRWRDLQEGRRRDTGGAPADRLPAPGDGLDGGGAHRTAGGRSDPGPAPPTELLHQPDGGRRTRVRISPAVPRVPALAGR